MKKKIPAPKISGEIGYKELYKVLKKKLRKAHIFLVDSKYQLVSKQEMERFLKEDKTDLISYISEFRDCDDRAWTLLGNINAGQWAGIAFGFAFSQVHAFNLFSDGKVVFVIEPQSDKILTIDKAKKIKSGPKREVSPYWPIQIVMM